MSFSEYIKDQITFIILNIFFNLLLLFYLPLFDIPNLAIYFLCVVWISLATIYFVISYFKRRIYYDDLTSLLQDDTLLNLTSFIEEPNFADAKPFYTAIELINYTFSDELAKYSKQNSSYQEYIEQWVHEIKTPVASLKLIIESEKEFLGKVAFEQLEEIQKLENYIDQTLYYSRMEYSQNDYFVSQFPIMKVVKKVIMKNQNAIRRSKITLDIKNSGETIFSDEKWLLFMINQILLNSIKYSKSKNAIISIYVEKNETSVTLNIKDNGIGIANSDLNRVFEKGFTGENGRVNEKSTGLGLFLVNELCKKLEHTLKIESVKNEFTLVSIVFPTSYYKAMVTEDNEI